MPTRHEGRRNLREIWSEPEGTTPICSLCSEPIGKQALVRTLRLCTSIPEPELPARASHSLKIPGGILVFIDRHMECIRANNLAYVTISHVWNPQVAQAQDLGAHDDYELTRFIFEQVTALFSGLNQGGISDIEIWYDYLSVPQWETEIKKEILLALPHIYGEASFTLILMRDIDRQAVERMRSGQIPTERLRGMTDICNGRWYKRVWTLVEFARSPRTRIMTCDFHLDEHAHDGFCSSMGMAWDDLLHHYRGDVLALEDAAQLKKNLVPWNLGSIAEISLLGQVDFGLAFAALTRRGCQSDRDFLFAMMGLVGVVIDPLDPNTGKALVQIAFGCMKKGDYSPLMVSPGSARDLRAVAQEGATDSEKEKFKYNDVVSFGFGARVADPLHDAFHASSAIEPPVARMRLERLGTVRACMRTVSAFERAQFILDTTGTDVEQFVRTLVERMHGMGDLADELLSDPISRETIAVELRGLYDNWGRNWPLSHVQKNEKLASLLRLNVLSGRAKGQTPQAFSNTHGGTIHFRTNDGVVRAVCGLCQREFAYRAGLFKRASEVLGATIYRIPGLRYFYSNANGCAILMKGGKIVGRMIWASPACPCKDTETVEIELGDLPLPDPL